jgi:hypothetical protein
MWSAPGWGSVEHNGSLIISNDLNGRQVRLQALNLSLLPNPGLSVTTSSGSGLLLFKVHMGQQPATGMGMTASSGGTLSNEIGYRGLGLRLTPVAARYLDRTLGTTAFAAGQTVGQATVDGIAAPSSTSP